MKLNKYSLALILGFGMLTSCNDRLELLNPNQQTSSTFGFNPDDLEECVIAAYNHIRMEGSYARVGYTIDVCRGDEAWNSSQGNFTRMSLPAFAETKIADKCPPGMCSAQWDSILTILSAESTKSVLPYSRK